MTVSPGATLHSGIAGDCLSHLPLTASALCLSRPLFLPYASCFLPLLPPVSCQGALVASDHVSQSVCASFGTSLSG